MNSNIMMTLTVVLTISLVGCAGMTNQEQGRLVGATFGAVAGLMGAGRSLTCIFSEVERSSFGLWYHSS